MAGRSLTSRLYRRASLSAIGTFVRKGYVTRRTRNITVGRALGLLATR